MDEILTWNVDNLSSAKTRRLPDYTLQSGYHGYDRVRFIGKVVPGCQNDPIHHLEVEWFRWWQTPHR